MAITTKKQRQQRRNEALQLFADGLRHEQVLLNKLDKAGHSIARLPGKQTEADYAATREAMAEGVEFIHQASLCNEEMRGSADLLRRIDRPSLLGEWSYIPIECKLASKPKTTFLVQASAYCELLTPLLGHRPDQFELYLGGGKFQPYGTDQFWAWYQLLRQRYRQFRESFDPSVIPEEVGIVIELSIMQGANIHSSSGRVKLIQSVLLKGKIELPWSTLD